MENSSAENARGLILLSALFTASLVCANLLGSKLVLVGGITLSVGIFVFPFTFVVADITTELYGKKLASYMVLVGILIQIYALFFVNVGLMLPASPRRDVGEAYAQMFSLTPRMVLASIVAYTFSQLWDVRLFAWIRTRTDGKHLWLRSNVSTYLSQAVDTAIFSAIFLGGILPVADLWKTGLTNYLVKILVSTCDTPFVYLGVYGIRKLIAQKTSVSEIEHDRRL